VNALGDYGAMAASAQWRGRSKSGRAGQGEVDMLSLRPATSVWPHAWAFQQWVGSAPRFSHEKLSGSLLAQGDAAGV